MDTASSPRRSRALAAVGAGLVAVAGSLTVPTPAAAAPPGCPAATVDAVLECVTLDGVRGHLQALQDIAGAHAGNRASGTPGYDASADYVAEQAAAAGLVVRRQQFDFPFFELHGSRVEQVAPSPARYAEGTDYVPLAFSGGGEVTAPVRAVDIVVPPSAQANGNTSGCEAADFAAFRPGEVALLQRGTCPFGQKVANARAAGAAAAVVFNEGQPGREEVLTGTLGEPVGIPVIGTGFATGSRLDGATVRIAVDSTSELRPTENVLAEIPGNRAAADVVMVGAHLDSVPDGPGINDNGSGSAAILEVARQLAAAQPDRTVRFAWWAAEELGLLGSTHYVSTLPPAELGKISAYLNFDMVGSPNFARFVYDGDDSDAVGAGPGPGGSGAIEDVFEAFYDDRGLAHEGTDFSGRSDYGPFIEAGVPAGGLFTGADGVKTDAQAARYGGTAGAAYDPCYHAGCDTIGNVEGTVLDENSDAIAFATLSLAASSGPVAGATARTPERAHRSN
jgi:Zn-dependent M28 family amino/carboxypeptidase